LRRIIVFLDVAFSSCFESRGAGYGMADEHASVESADDLFRLWLYSRLVLHRMLSSSSGQVGPYSQGESLQFLWP
jgi:hypothetical protein